MSRHIRRNAVVTGDHGLPDPTKRGGSYHEAMASALRSLAGYEVLFWSDHGRLLDLLRDQRPDLVVDFCDTGFRNVATRELNLPAYLELLRSLGYPCFLRVGFANAAWLGVLLGQLPHPTYI